jgi:hypothetical protein
MVTMTEPATARRAIVAVPEDAVAELEELDLARPVFAFRGPALDAAVAIGTDAAALVTLLQAPEAIRGFAAWIRARCERTGDAIEVVARHGDVKVRLRVTGEVSPQVIFDFLTEIFDGS